MKKFEQFIDSLYLLQEEVITPVVLPMMGAVVLGLTIVHFLNNGLPKVQKIIDTVPSVSCEIK